MGGRSISMGGAKSQWGGMLNLNRETRPPYNLSTGCNYIPDTSMVAYPGTSDLVSDKAQTAIGL